MNPAVEHVDVVEIDQNVLAIVGPTFTGEPRLTLYEGDALTIAWPAGVRWDYAWHDVWSEHRALALVHAELILRYREYCRQQGAWQFPRWCARLWPEPLVRT